METVWVARNGLSGKDAREQPLFSWSTSAAGDIEIPAALVFVGPRSTAVVVSIVRRASRRLLTTPLPNGDNDNTVRCAIGPLRTGAAGASNLQLTSTVFKSVAMSELPTLRVSGEVKNAREFTFKDLAGLDARWQIEDVSRLDPKRQGGAVRLAGLLALAGPNAAARYLTLHAVQDDFHASVPLAAVQDRAVVIYRLADGPLPTAAGGPFRFFIPDFAACQTHEVDECASVKFVNQLELSSQRGFDNRPADEKEHAALHAKEELG